MASEQLRLNDRVYTTMDRGRLAIAVVYTGIILTVVLVGMAVALVWKMVLL